MKVCCLFLGKMIKRHLDGKSGFKEEIHYIQTYKAISSMLHPCFLTRFYGCWVCLNFAYSFYLLYTALCGDEVVFQERVWRIIWKKLRNHYMHKNKVDSKQTEAFYVISDLFPSSLMSQSNTYWKVLLLDWSCCCYIVNPGSIAVQSTHWRYWHWHLRCGSQLLH